MNDFPLEPADPRLAWLPAVLPASATSLEPPNIEIATGGKVRGDADVVAVPFLARTPEENPLRLVRGAQRVVRSLGVQARAAVAATRLEQLGYPVVEILSWNLEGELGTGALPLGAVAVGRRTASNTVLQALVGDAGTRPALLREGAVVALTDTEVFRVSIGPSRAVDGQVKALRNLRAVGFISEVVPWTTESGEIGLAHWSREPLLPGTSARVLDETLLDECVRFLGQLSSYSEGFSGAHPVPSDDALAAAAQKAASVRLLGWLAHGDFHTGNLLVSTGHLTGVIDWDAAGGRLPLHDYLQLIATDDYLRHRRNLGPTVVQFLLPWARAGGDERARGLLSRAGIKATPDLLEGLVAAYWLDFVKGDIAKSADRLERRRWREENVDLVARAFA